MADVKLNIVTATNLQGLNQLKAKLEEVKKVAQSADEGGFFNLSAQEINQTVSAVNALQHALTAAYDTKLNTINVEKFNKILAKNNITVKDLYTNLSRAGVVGQQAFMDMTQSTLMMGRSVKQTSKFVEEMQTTMMNTVKWGISSGLWNTMLSSVSKAWGYVKGLNADLTDIRIVTGKSADQMERFAKTANKAAKDLGVATRDYTQGALLYYQQGDDDETVKTKTDITAKASNITGQDMSTVSEQLTAVWNGYQVANQAAEDGMQVYEEYVDKLSAVAATTASDLEEQATAMSKVASAAYSMGVNFDDLNAQIATIVSVTRQAPESVGTALKTIYARLGDLKVDGVDEFGTKLGEVSGQLQTMGIEVLDSNGDMREMSTVMTEVAEKWNTWTSAQKQAAAVAMAGKRQYNNLIALFDNWDMYGESLETSMEAAGTLSEQQGIAMDSLEKKMQRMTTASEKMYNALFDEKSIGGLIDGLTTVVDLIGSAVEGVGGLSTILPAVGGMMLKSFGGKIASSITTKIENKNTRNAELDNDKAKLKLANQLGKEGAFLNEDGSKDSLIENEIKANVGFYKDMYKYRKQMTDEELAATNELTKRRAVLSNEKIKIKENLELAREKNAISKEEYKTLLEINEAGADGQKKLQELKEKNEKRQHTLEKLTSFAFDETDLSKQGTKEEALNFSAEYKHDLNGYRKNATNFITQDSQVNYEISEVLKQAEKEGLEVEEVIKRINKKMVELGKNDIIKDEEVKNIEQIYNDMQDITKEYKGKLGADFETVIGESMRNSLGPDSEEAINTLKTKVVELQSNGMSLQEALIKAMDDLRQESKDLDKDLEKIDLQIIKEKDIKAEQEAIKKVQELKQKIEGITTAVGGVTQAWGGFTGIMNSFSSATDPALDSTERLKAAFSGLTFAVPFFVKGIGSIITGLKNATVATSGLHKALVSLELFLKKNLALIGGIAAIAGVAIGGIVLALNNYQSSLEASMYEAQKAHRASLERATVAKKEKDEIDAIVKSYKELKEEYKDKSLDELRIKTADLCIQYNQQDLALKALIADYDELNKIMNDAQSEKNDAYIEKGEKVIKTGKIEIARTMIANAGFSIEDEVDGESALDIVDGWFANSREKQIQEVLSKYGVETVDGHIYTEDFANAIINDYDDIYAELSKINEDAAEDLLEVMESVSDEVKKLKDETIEPVKETKKQVISDNYKNKDINTFEEYSKAIDDMTEQVKIYFDSVKEAKAWAENQLIENKDNLRFANINNLANKQLEQDENTSNETIEKITKDLEQLNDEELNFALQYFDMKAIDESFAEFAKKYSNFITYLNKENQIVPTIDFILNDKDAKEITEEQLDSLFSSDDFEKSMDISKEQFETLDFEKQRLLMSQYYLDYQKYITENKDAIVKSIEETADELNNMDIKFEGYDKKWIKTVGNIDFLKNNFSEDLEPILKELGIEYEDVANMLETYATKGVKGFTEAEANIYARLQEIGIGGKAVEVENKLSDISNNYSLSQEEKIKQIKEQFGEQLQPILEESGISYEELIDIYITQYEGGVEALTDKSKGIFNKTSAMIAEYSNQVFSKDLMNNIGKALSLNKRYEAQVKSTTEALEKAKKGEADYQEVLKAARGQYTYVNEGIDNIQDGFSQLTSIVEDFNNNGTLSLDSLQTLLTMSDEMLACLELENGQMTINGDKMKEMTLARLDEAKATVMQETQAGLLAIVNEKVAESENQAAYQAFLHKETVLKGAEAARISGDEWLRYNAIVGDVDLSKIYNSQEAQDFLENQRKKMLGLESAAEGLKNMDMTIISGDERDEELKKLEDEFDRYWDLNNAIDATSKALEDLSETQDKLTRGELQDSLREQNELLEQQIVNYQNLRKEQEKEAGELKGKLLTFGVDFNADGSIANYAEATQEALNYYNNVAQRYNKGTVSDEGLETAEKSYEEFKETLERYDSLYYDEMVETAENIADTQREILENNLQDFELSITIKTDAAEFDREVKDFKTEIAKDFTKAFEDIDSVIEKSQFDVESYGESFNAVAAGISKVEEEILKLHNGENSDMFSSITEAQEKLKELNKEAMEHASNMKAAYEEAWEAYLEGIDQSQEKFDDLQEKYSKINEELEYQKELIELIYGPKAYDLMDKFYEKQKENSLSQIKSLQYEKELWLSKYDAEAAKAGDEDQLKIAERISQIQSDLNSNVTSYIQLLKDEYANTISGILSNFESQLTNGSSLDDIAEEWERLTENSDKYFNNVEGLYETQTLANKIKDSINDTISVKNQEKLQALYDREIEYLREKENLTQYDLDAAEARYQIALKEIALEEARENKNAMKLMRDTNGNWSYQYVADEDNIAEKQQELSDAMYKFYELSDKAYQENLESIQKLNQEYFDKAEEIATNELLTEQEKELKLEELRKWYLNQYQLLVSENEIIRQNLANGTVGVLNNLYNQDATNFENMTLQEQAAITQVKELGITSFAELEDKARQNIEGIGNSINIVAEQNIPEMTSKTQELANTWGADDGASVKAQSLDAFNSMMEVSEQYRDSLDEIAAAIKEDWGPEGITGAIDGVSQAIKDVEEATKKLCANTEKNLTDYQTKVNNLAEKWNGVKTAIGDSIEQLNALYELQGNPPKVNIPGGTGEQGGGGGFTDVLNSISGNGSSLANIGATIRDKVNDAIPKGKVYFGNRVQLYASPGGGMKQLTDSRGTFEYELKNKGETYPYYIKEVDNKGNIIKDGYITEKEFKEGKAFDTGGYTGEWGSEGRMAMLHEKELVLNKEDTSNILAAVNGIRQFSSIESAISKGIASMIMNMTGMGVNVNYNTNEAKGNQTKQVFNIQAEFPNANSVDEIREAILSLPGLASQQAGLNFI